MFGSRKFFKALDIDINCASDPSTPREEVLEEGYVRASLERGATFVRLPWVTKPTVQAVTPEEPPY